MLNLVGSGNSALVTLSMYVPLLGGAFSKFSSFWKKAEHGRSGSVAYLIAPELL